VKLFNGLVGFGGGGKTSAVGSDGTGGRGGGALLGGVRFLDGLMGADQNGKGGWGRGKHPRSVCGEILGSLGQPYRQFSQRHIWKVQMGLVRDCGVKCSEWNS